MVVCNLFVLQALYKLGGRKFWIYNTGPFGCMPQTPALRKTSDSELDEIGCMAVYNNDAKAFNEGLLDLCDKMRSELEDAAIIHTDMYAIKYDLFANPSKYGEIFTSSIFDSFFLFSWSGRGSGNGNVYPGVKSVYVTVYTVIPVMELNFVISWACLGFFGLIKT